MKIRKLFATLVLVFMFCCQAMPLMAAVDATHLVNDEAAIMTPEEISALEAEAQTIRNE